MGVKRALDGTKNKRKVKKNKRNQPEDTDLSSVDNHQEIVQHKDYNHDDELQKFWHSLQHSINNISSKVKKPLKKINLHENYKYKELNTDKDLEIVFEKPELCTVLELYRRNASNNTKELDVNVTMPLCCFQRKDYLNNRYFVKRNYYLRFLCETLERARKDLVMEIKYQHDNPLCPYVNVQKKNQRDVAINIFATSNFERGDVESEYYWNRVRCLPDRNNIKVPLDTDFPDLDIQKFEEVGTPLYNTVLAKDWTLQSNNSFVISNLNQEYYKEFVAKVCLWLDQRDLANGITGFHSDLVHLIVAHLANKKQIQEHLSLSHSFRIFCNFLTTNDWSEKTFSLCENVDEERSTSFKVNFEVVFLDTTGYFNVAAFLDVDTYQKVRNEARRALEILDNNSINAIEFLFHRRHPLVLQFDAIIKVIQDKDNTVYEQTSDTDKWKYYFFRDLLTMKKSQEVLTQGLGNRFRTLMIAHQNDANLNSENTSARIFMFGVTLNPEAAFTLITRGPTIEDRPGLAEFEKFWGRFAKFRRFPDSTACEVADFSKSNNTVKDRRNVVVTIMKYILEEKLSLKVEVVANQCDDVIVDNIRKTPFPTGSNEEACARVKYIFDDLTSKIRNFSMEPAINTIQGVSAAFSYTEPFPPIPTNYRCGKKITTGAGKCIVFKKSKNYNSVPRYAHPIECIIHLARFSGWPKELEALRAARCKIFFRIAEILKEQHEILTTIVKLDYLDVFYEGLVFRFRIFIEKEITLMKRNVDTDGLISFKHSEESLKVEQDMEIRPKVTSALNGIQQINPCFGASCALIKRWLRAQMIDGFYISDTTIDLWNASLFVNMSAYQKPNLPQVAFLRFLNHVANFDPSTEAVIVNFNDDIEAESLGEYKERIVKERTRLPNLYIIMPYDKGESIFTKAQPSKSILSRIQQLATVSLDYLSKVSTNWDTFRIWDLFNSQSSGYDFVIHLLSRMNPLHYQEVTEKEPEKKKEMETYDKCISNLIPVIDFNPVREFLKELREIYNDYVLFFHNTHGGNTIGCMLVKKELAPKEVKPENVYGRTLVDNHLQFDVDALMEDIFNRGEGLISKIEKV